MEGVAMTIRGYKYHPDLDRAYSFGMRDAANRRKYMHLIPKGSRLDNEYCRECYRQGWEKVRNK
jgi:hypothetical protein